MDDLRSSRQFRAGQDNCSASALTANPRASAVLPTTQAPLHWRMRKEKRARIDDLSEKVLTGQLSRSRLADCWNGHPLTLGLAASE
ncbi:hypothetical protein LCGC14_1613120 [marine sediment metagenome]|uniref:Uncharacterized protein n=1 Tax=marine sediment metagenome TaxID=412755 RepID=A0A0F9L7U9_9ZZZZ